MADGLATDVTAVERHREMHSAKLSLARSDRALS